MVSGGEGVQRKVVVLGRERDRQGGKLHVFPAGSFLGCTSIGLKTGEDEKEEAAAVILKTFNFSWKILPVISVENTHDSGPN